MRTRRLLLAGTTYVSTLRIFLLFSFPNGCDHSAYRDITLYAYSMAPNRPGSGSSCTVPFSSRPRPVPTSPPSRRPPPHGGDAA
ncbi:MAG TPA: hypothetical protein VF847_00350 [Candidatus Deferrimicrobiaceae bacterium]